MSDRETIKEFLVKFGYEVDVNSQRQAEQQISIFTAAVTKLGGALLSLYAVNTVLKLNDQFARLHQTTKTIGTTAETLQGIGRAAELTGSSIGAMQGALENFSQKMRTLGPAFSNWVDAQAGKNISGMEDRGKALIEFAERVNKKFQYPIAVKVMETAGVGEREFLSLLDPMTKKIIEEQNKISENFGLNTKKMMQDAQDFATNWSGLIARVSAVYQKATIKGDFAKGLESLNEFIDKNKDTIVGGLNLISDAVERVASALGVASGLFDKNDKAFSKGGGFLEGFADWLEGRETKGGPQPTPGGENASIPESVAVNIDATRDNTEALRENTKAQRDGDKKGEGKSFWDRAKEFYKEHDPAQWIAERMKDIFGAGGAGVGGSTGRGGGGMFGGGSGGGSGVGPNSGGHNIGWGKGGTTPSVAAQKAAALIKKVGGTDEEARVLGAIAAAESGGNPNALNNRGEYSVGLWQMNMRAHGTRFGTEAQLRDPEHNARAALALSRRSGGFRDWSVYKSGAYARYLGAAESAARGPGRGWNESPAGSNAAPTQRAPRALPPIVVKPQAALNPAAINPRLHSREAHPLGHQVANYHTMNNNSRVASLGPFNTTIHVPGGQIPGASTLTHAVENSMRKVAAAGISNLGTQIS